MQWSKLTDKLVLHTSWSRWLYPTMIVLSIVAASLDIFVLSDGVMHQFIIMWFLLVCPGMAVVRFFQLKEVAVEWLLALALSIAIDAFIAGILLYAGWWSPLNIFIVLISFCLIGAMMQLVLPLEGKKREKT